MVPWFQYCTDLWFTGYDPPRTLIPAAAMASPVATSDPTDPTTTPQTRATQDPGAKSTATAAESTPMPLPSHVQHAPLPKMTNTVPDFKPEVPKETSQVSLIQTQEP